MTIITLLLDKFILMQCRNCSCMWLIMIDKDTISMLDGCSFSTDLLLSIIKISNFQVNQKYEAS